MCYSQIFVHKNNGTRLWLMDLISFLQHDYDSGMLLKRGTFFESTHIKINKNWQLYKLVLVLGICSYLIKSFRELREENIQKYEKGDTTRMLLLLICSVVLFMLFLYFISTLFSLWVSLLCNGSLTSKLTIWSVLLWTWMRKHFLCIYFLFFYALVLACFWSERLWWWLLCKQKMLQEGGKICVCWMYANKEKM